MVEVRLQKMQKAAFSDCRSLGSSQRPSGRFPKISIGISVEKCPTLCDGLRSEDTAALAAKRTSSFQVAEQTTKQGIIETSERNRPEIEDCKNLAWFSTKSKPEHPETPNGETVKFFVNQASVVQLKEGVQKKYDAVAYRKRRESDGNVKTVEEVAFAAMKETNLIDKGHVREEHEVVRCNEKRLSSITFGRTKEKVGNVEWTEDVAFSTKQVIDGENGKEPEKIVKCTNEALRMKLWEILGTVPSQNKHTMNSPEKSACQEGINANQSTEKVKNNVTSTKLNSQDFEENKENFHVNQNRQYQKDHTARVKTNLQNIQVNKENLNVQQSKKNQKGKATRAKQNSDTIESDSESPKEVVRRPVTRSVARKKAQPKRMSKLQADASFAKKPFSSSSSDFKLKVDNNSFAFDEDETNIGSLCRTSNSLSNRSKGKVKEKMSAKFEPRRIYFPESSSEKSLQNTTRKQASLSTNKTSSFSKEKGDSTLQTRNKKELLQTQDHTPTGNHHPQKGAQLNSSSPLPAYNRQTHNHTVSPLFRMKTHSWGHENSPAEPKHENVACRPMGREYDLLDGSHFPVSARNLCPTSPRMAKNDVLYSPRNLTPKSGSTDFDSSSPSSCQPDVDVESSDDDRDTHKHGDMEHPRLYCEETEKQLPLSPVEGDAESEADDLISPGFGVIDKWFPSPQSPEKSLFLLHQAKRARSLKNVPRSKADFPSSPPIDTLRTEGTIGSLEALEKYPEGSLPRCIAQLALVLERFRRNMKSHTIKKSSEILSSTAEKIRQQLQDVESQIMADVGKFNNNGKSKRKRLELRFQEHQDRLRVTHNKFKEEVNQHLVDCRSTVEELEAYNMDLKGNSDKQKASHRKLLVQAEEAMEAQLKDAEARIAMIHKDSKKKMIGLKRALKEWMN